MKSTSVLLTPTLNARSHGFWKPLAEKSGWSVGGPVGRRYDLCP